MNTTPSRDEALFTDALAQPPAERGAFLAEACGTDVGLLARVRALVAAHEGPDSLLAGAPVPLPAVHEERSGDQIGNYKLLEKIGEGGCGVVWMAEQEQPVRRRVALKVIKLGMDTKAVITRFEAERQALAMMDHHNIAKVFEAGCTSAGRPYFVMELVDGVRITAFCVVAIQFQLQLRFGPELDPLERGREQPARRFVQRSFDGSVELALLGRLGRCGPGFEIGWSLQSKCAVTLPRTGRIFSEDSR